MYNRIGLLLPIVSAVVLLTTSPVFGRPSARDDDDDVRPFFDSMAVEATAAEEAIDAADAGDAGDAIAAGRTRRGVHEICGWFNSKIGWGCDDAVSRAAWRWLNDVSDCDGFCRKKGYSGGQCESGNTDISSWCPKGKHCHCT